MKRYLYSILFLISFLPVSSSLAQDYSDSSGVFPLNYNNPKEYEIGGITISGTQFFDENIIITLSGLIVGEHILIPGDVVSNAIKNLWKQGLFTNIKITVIKIIDRKVFLNIYLQERPRLSKLKFKGIKKSDADEIKDRIGLIKGKVVTENLKINAINLVTDYYINKGFLNIKVDTYEKPDTTLSNNIALIIDIKKGEKVRIDQINFFGNKQASDKKLKKQMKGVNEKSRFDVFKNIDSLKNIDLFRPLNPIIFLSKIYTYISDNVKIKFLSSSKFVEENFNESKVKIIDYYNSKGYKDARIIDDTLFISDNNNLIINITIKEGGKYYFRDITWNGNTKYTSKLLNEVLGIKKGEIYDQSLLEQQLYANQNGRDISSLYMDDGYLFFQINPLEKYVEGDSLDLEIRIYEGPQAIINKITISGNTKTNEHVIRRELRTLPGEKFSRSDVIRSQREIANLSFFNPENMDVVPIPHPENGTVDIEYKVEEKPSDQIELSAGWGAGRLLGTLGVSFNNFSIGNIFNKKSWTPLPSGDGQRLSIRAQSTGGRRRFQSLNFSFTEPWLGGKKPNAFSIAAYTSKDALSDINSNDNTMSKYLVTNGGSISLGKRLRKPDDYFTLLSALEYQHYRLKDWYAFSFISEGTFNNLSIKEIFARNSIVQPIYTKEGSKLSLTVQATPPYSWLSELFGQEKDYSTLTDEQKFKWLEYHKWKFDAEWYMPLTSSAAGKHTLVLKLRSSFGFLGYYNKNIGFTPFERFEVGGDGLSNFVVYGREIIALRGGYQPFISDATIFNKFVLELRYPFSLNPMSTIYGLAFLEAGNGWSNFKKFDPFSLKRSAGVGLRVFLPMFGLIGIDYGIPFDMPGNVFQNGGFNFILGFEPY